MDGQRAIANVRVADAEVRIRPILVEGAHVGPFERKLLRDVCICNVYIVNKKLSIATSVEASLKEEQRAVRHVELAAAVGASVESDAEPVGVQV